jgi:uncharacterized protein
MDSRLLPHNTHIENPDTFSDLDPQLRLLSRQPFVFHSPLLEQIPRNEPGIYTLTGGRQTGKTTLLKQWMVKLMASRVAPENIAYITGELIDDHHSLIKIISESAREMPESHLNFILLDEVTYIRHWDQGIKYLADAGMLENVILVITGSDLVIIKEARMRFPGRRGLSDKADFHLRTLSFQEFVGLTEKITHTDINFLLSSEDVPPPELLDALFEAFESYLIHGGFLTAINDMSIHGRVLPATFSTYSDWIRGDVLKRKKQEHYLFEVLEAIVKRYGTQVTWNALSDDLSIDHPKTVSDYVSLLVSMDAVFVQSALLEHKLIAAPKKARKVMFLDPFIFHAVRAWIKPCEDPFNEQVKPLLLDTDGSAKLVEACVSTHYSRSFPTYYIKAKGEVDVAYVSRGTFRPIEVKWTRQLRPKQLKQILKYKNGIILTKSRHSGDIQGVPTMPLPLALFGLG